MLPIFAEIRHLLVIHLWYNPSGYMQDNPAYNTFWYFLLFTGWSCI